MGGGGRHHRNGGDAASEKRPRVDEKAYQAALKKIPDRKGSNDPWGSVRAADPGAKKAK